MTETSSVTWLTQEAHDRLKAELDHLSGEGRTEIARKIEEARQEGDLRENGGYHAAKEEQGKQEARIRQLHAEGKVDREALLDAEAASYHGRGTCTFYGTANSNQLLMEAMGLHLPGSSLVNPDTPLRDALTVEAGKRVTGLTAMGEEYTPVGAVVDEKAIVNGCVALLATGGSTNHNFWVDVYFQPTQ